MCVCWDVCTHALEMGVVPLQLDVYTLRHHEACDVWLQWKLPVLFIIFLCPPHPLPSQILQWLQSEVDRLASQHTDIGEISEDAVEAKTAFEEIMQKRAVSGNGVCAYL